MKPVLATPLLLVALTAVGCGAVRASAGDREPRASSLRASAIALHALALDRSRTRPLGIGARFRPPATGALVRAHGAVGALRCGTPGRHPYGAHVELFAQGHEVAVPAGIGIAPPQHRDGASVVGGRCSYPVRTSDPTGVILVDSPAAGEAQPTVGELFKLWGQPLGVHDLAGFKALRNGSVIAFVDGREVSGDPRAVPLRRHAQIVLEVGPRVAPHPSYRFVPGL